jgi:hypothetical protein
MPGVSAVGHVCGRAWHPGQADGCVKCAPDTPRRSWQTGEAVTVVEYGRDRRPRPYGTRLPARVTGTAGVFVLITYDDPGRAGRERDQFYADSGWWAMDGELRWKLHHGNPPGDLSGRPRS